MFSRYRSNLNRLHWQVVVVRTNHVTWSLSGEPSEPSSFVYGVDYVEKNLIILQQVKGYRCCCLFYRIFMEMLSQLRSYIGTKLLARVSELFTIPPAYTSQNLPWYNHIPSWWVVQVWGVFDVVIAGGAETATSMPRRISKWGVTADTLLRRGPGSSKCPCKTPEQSLLSCLVSLVAQVERLHCTCNSVSGGVTFDCDNKCVSVRNWGCLCRL